MSNVDADLFAPITTTPGSPLSEDVRIAEIIINEMVKRLDGMAFGEEITFAYTAPTGTHSRYYLTLTNREIIT